MPSMVPGKERGRSCTYRILTIHHQMRLAEGYPAMYDTHASDTSASHLTPENVRSRWGAEPLIRNALFRVKKGRMIHTLEFSTIWRILVDSEMNSHANPQEFTEW